MLDYLNDGPAMLGFIGSLLIAFTLGLSVGINSEKRFKRRTGAQSGNVFEREYNCECQQSFTKQEE